MRTNESTEVSDVFSSPLLMPRNLKETNIVDVQFSSACEDRSASEVARHKRHREDTNLDNRGVVIHVHDAVPLLPRHARPVPSLYPRKDAEFRA